MDTFKIEKGYKLMYWRVIEDMRVKQGRDEELEEERSRLLEEQQ